MQGKRNNEIGNSRFKQQPKIQQKQNNDRNKFKLKTTNKKKLKSIF